MPQPLDKGEEKKPKSGSTMPTIKGNTLFHVGLVFSLAASFLIIAEGIILIARSPLPYQIWFLADWGGFLDVLFGVITLVGFFGIALMHRHKKVKTTSATAICILSILSFILFGGGFYVGFILGLFGALLTASRD